MDIIMKHVHNSTSCFLGDTTEAAGPEENLVPEIPLLCFLSFLHFPFEEDVFTLRLWEI